MEERELPKPINESIFPWSNIEYKVISDNWTRKRAIFEVAIEHERNDFANNVGIANAEPEQELL